MSLHPDLPPLPVVAIVGATGAVGAELVACLERRSFPLARLRLLASPRSAGRVLRFRGQPITVEALTSDSFAGVDLAFFAAGATISRRYAALAQSAGARVVDNSSAFRADPRVPLVVPEANGRLLDRRPDLVANPNCVAAILTTVLAPIQARWSLSRLNLATYQAASGAGAAAMAELRGATAAALAGEAFAPAVLPHPYAFNLFSHNAGIDPETGYNGEELKVVAETRRILNLPRLPISVTCIRVPVLRAHGLAVTLRLDELACPDRIRAALTGAPGLALVDDRAGNHFPMPSEASGRDEVLVGRIRRDLGDPSGRSVAFFAVGDQLLKGAALNAVQIAERLLQTAALRAA